MSLELEEKGTLVPVVNRRGLAEEQKVAEVLKHMSPRGSLGLPRLLEEKRWKYGIPDQVIFNQHAVFNKVLVLQIPEEESDTYAGGLIVKTETTKKRELTEAPRGVIISAGLQALDELRSNGVDIGHTVGFTRLAPFRRPVATIAGNQVHLVVLHAGDIIDSEDLAQALKARRARVVTKPNEEGVNIHYFIDENGKPWSPIDALVPEDN